jgi:protoporphyrinogen/coproporphyrinogen III oxidase
VSSNRKTVIIGGGISGLTAAHYCIGEAVVIEAEARLGGVLRTEYREGCVVEQGADAWLTSKPWAAELAREVGLGNQLTGSNDAARRTFIWKKGEAVEFPDGMQLVAPTSAMPILRSKLLSPYTKLRMALDWLPTFKPGRMAERERTVGAMVADHFGMEAVDYIAEPLLSGIYGGDPFELSATSVLPKLVERERKTDSLIRGAKLEQREGALFTTIRDGLEKLIEKLTPKELVRGRAEQVEQVSGGYRVRVGGDWMEADRVVIACETHQAATLMPELGSLRRFRHSSASAVSLGFRREDVAHPLNGFGLLIPKCERRKMTACTWMNTKFPHRVAEGIVLLRCFFSDVKSGDEELVGTARAELRETMGVTGAPVFQTVARWPKSLPLYEVGHEKRVAETERLVAALPGLRLIGNAYHGVGIPDCVKLAKSAAVGFGG